jgi:hypothetical protein
VALKSTFTSFNLPVYNVEKAKTFFTGLGFKINPEFPENENSVAILIGDNLQVMLLTKELLKSLTQKETVDTEKYAQMTIALTFESREKVDEIVNTAVSLGGKRMRNLKTMDSCIIGPSRTWTAICGQSTT